MTHDHSTADRSGSPGATIDLRAQVLEMLCPTAAMAQLASVCNEPPGVLLLTKDSDLARCLAPGRWVHAVGAARLFCPQFVCALEMTSCVPIPDEEWGGAEYVGFVEHLVPPTITARARVMSEWRYYEEVDSGGHRQSGYTADVALPTGEDGTRAVLHWWQGTSDCRIRNGEPPVIERDELVNVHAHLDWYPYRLCKPLPPRTPILDLWDASSIAVVDR